MKNTKDCSFCDMTDKALKELESGNNSLKNQKSSKGPRAILLVVILLLITSLLVWKNTNARVKGQDEQMSLGEDTSSEKKQDFLQISSFAPDFTTNDIAGNEVTLSEFRNKKPVLLVFWATWCGYCAQELPDLEAFNRKHQDELQVLVLPGGEVKSTVEKYIKEKNINFTMLLDETKDIWNTYLVRGTPSHFLIDKTGKLVTLRYGLATLSDLEILLTMLP